ncbi:MAG: AAA family ATPase [Oscillospiraceae bacterium]|nr:AAA family ATPase [Oscillospiraceae bacterium]
MKIHKMTASFGRLQNETIELGDGLNIVYAPNERGKSTWCGFIKAMLYGIESSAREKAGVKPDKVRFAPWSGAPMAGSMDIEYAGAKITLIRKGRESAQMRDFSALLTGSSSRVKEIDASSVGETLLGVSKDVFERSAFIGQGKLAVGGSPELERRIASIVSTGDENSSATEAEERIKAAIRRRRFNKSGRMPEIEHEMDEIRGELSESVRESLKGDELRRVKAAALEKRDALFAKLADSRKATRHETLEKLTGSRNNVKELENGYNEQYERLVAAERKLDAGFFGRQNPQECRSRFEADEDKLRLIGESAKKGGSARGNIALFIVLALAAVAFELLADFGLLPLEGIAAYIPRVTAGVLALIQLVRILVLRKKRKTLAASRDEVLLQYGGKSEEAVSTLLSAHEKDYSEFVLAETGRTEALEQLEAGRLKQAELESAVLKDLDFTDGSSEAARYKKLLDDAEATLRGIREQFAAWEGRQSVMKDPEEMKSRLSALTSERERLTEELDALTLALDTLRAAGEEISHRLTPRLSARTAELFSALTASRYDAVLLDKELKAAARPEGDSVPREASFLSAGTIDQLYLAVRLAICELALPEEKSCPIILDDALVSFDDERCERALALLRELAVNRQIILFTCHRREAELVKAFSDVRVAEI